MKIVIIGAGGVGGYFGGKLAQAGFDVTFVVRGEHLSAIKENGLQIKSIKGDFTVHPKVTDDIQTIYDPDLIILGVKSWQVIDVAINLKSVISKNTMVLPLQNGADNANKLLLVLNEENVLAGLSKIVSKIEAPGIIRHFAFEPEIIFGEINNESTSRVKSVKNVFDKAEFKNRISDNIQLDIWRKFLFIVSISGIAALTRVVIGEIREDMYLRKICYQTALEIMDIANAKGISLSKTDIENAMQAIDNTDFQTTASMQRDIMENRPSELDNFNGYIVRQGRELQIETPINDFIYYCLLPQEKRARGTEG
ncbi:MAG: 2-dehydropantoate 2-reductase [Flavobacteriaceae bacterium]|nr:2-dehydropantoate 2-reductase [Flavobacteriaceae bacterium]